ncbi:apoptogenic protein 1, mitochondrial [Eurytemora carolleeae]|uniref:apoptogenic protein 1, mitochondrial n=1 Tax=Eurytemora carolleeae TaxID=1294199 RepID=UPI000C7826F5|nr:apoptogenic protein 1, mitochondrial [Eurytemora carolleeae]|eukprot:XP_023343678.1 apoptogenic protein 1, mitochondrial-like [Eurytemora affinis]
MALSGRLFERLCTPTNIKIVGKRHVHKNNQTVCEEMIGPAHPISNLRALQLGRKHNETKYEVKLRLVRQETQMFNQEFWVEHNTAFKQGREKFINNLLAVKYPTEKDKKTLTSEEMSEFYREFMNQQWRNHLQYNLDWQKRNFKIIFLTGIVRIQALLSFLR